MRLNIIFPSERLVPGNIIVPAMPLAPPMLAALTPEDIDIKLIDMSSGDIINYDENIDLVAITVRTPLADISYEIADEFRKRGVKIVLGGPHVTYLPLEGKKHADSVVIGEAEETWPVLINDFVKDRIKDFYVAGPFDIRSLKGEVYHIPKRPDLKKLPFAKRNLFSRRRYMMDSIFTTRGCPNYCRFCPVTPLFGGMIRHRPIDEVVSEVESLKSMYFNVDDSVFGHPQIIEKPEENKYYLDLYTELSKIKPKKYWSGAGGLSAVNYRDGRKIFERAVESGLTSIAAGLESISKSGQKESRAWRKLHATDPENFDIKKMKENIKTIKAHGIEILGFFIIGWDDDTVDTYYRTLDFCDETGIIPVIFTLFPMPGSDLYEEYLRDGKILPGKKWRDFGGFSVVFRHPNMTEEEMLKANYGVAKKGFTMRRIFIRSINAFRYNPRLKIFFNSFFTQWGLRKVLPEMFKGGLYEKGKP
jgi:radical SAM superfamily enzyme YgiQ (UPF0313 family)